MILTVNSDCTSIEVVSTLVDSFVADPTLTFTVTFVDCENTSYSYEIEGEDITEGETNILTLIPSQIISEDATEFPDGVYSVTLKLDDDGTITQEIKCLLIDCDLECRVFDFQSENLDSKIFMYYQALIYGPDCDNCNCSGMCALYNKILSLLNENSSENDCGC